MFSNLGRMDSIDVFHVIFAVERARISCTERCRGRTEGAAGRGLQMVYYGLLLLLDTLSPNMGDLKKYIYI